MGNTYAILEANMGRLEKKLNLIQKKCQVYGCTFRYQRKGETFKEIVDGSGHKYTAKFILVEAEGTAIINNWQFVASVEHTENGNIFHNCSDIEIPKQYYGSKPVCEHCNSNRYRKYTYLVRNTETGEFKQVGKSCLRDFTHGLSAEMAAQYISLFDTLIKGETPYPGCSIERYLPCEEYLDYVAETIRHFGYRKSSLEGTGEQSTKMRAMDYYNASRGIAVSDSYLKHLQTEMSEVGFDPQYPETVALVKDALAWIHNEEDGSNYIHNLKTVCSLPYITYQNHGLLTSLIPAYRREQKRQMQKNYYHGLDEKSEHVGAINGKIKVQVASVTCLSSWETPYGTLRFYKIVGTDDNIYTWKTTKALGSSEVGRVLTGWVKAHTEFQGVKQTELTRCRV